MFQQATQRPEEWNCEVLQSSGGVVALLERNVDAAAAQEGDGEQRAQGRCLQVLPGYPFLLETVGFCVWVLCLLCGCTKAVKQASTDSDRQGGAGISFSSKRRFIYL